MIPKAEIYFSSYSAIALNLDLLDQQEYERYASSHKGLKFALGRIFLKQKLGEHLQIDPSRVQISYTETEKPFLKDFKVEFSLSHSGEYLGVAIGTQQLGFDLQVMQGIENWQQKAQRFFNWSAQELNKYTVQDFCLHWAIAESMSKCLEKSLFTMLKYNWLEEGDELFRKFGVQNWHSQANQLAMSLSELRK